MPAASKHATLAVASVALLAAFALAGSAGSVQLPGKRDREAPTAPANVRVTSATPTSVSLAWDPSADNVGVAFYYVYIDGRRTRVDGTTHTASNLECGQSVGVRIVAYDFAVNRSSSATATVSTAACVDMQPPTPPSGFGQAATTETAVVLEWNESSDDVGVVEYGVYRNQLPVQSPSQPSATLTDLYCGSTFEYQVDAVDAAGNRSQRRSAWVQTARCSDLPPPPVDSQPPSQPTDLGISSVTASSVSLTWSPSTDNVGVAGYDVFKNGTKMASVSSTSSSQDGLDCATSYSFGVEAFDGVGNRSGRALVNATTSACLPPPPPPPTVPPPPPADTSPPTQPANLGVDAATRTSVSLTWVASTDDVGVAAYRVYVNGVGVLDPTQPGATVEALTCGTAFTFEVDAADSAGNRSTRARITASTSACADAQAPTVPTSVVASSRTATSIALTWSASTDNAGVTGYGLYRGGTLMGTSATTTGIFAGLTCNTNYTLAVDAQDAAGNRSEKATVMVATTACADTAAPSSPTNLAASSVTQSSLTLTWNASTDNVGVTGYDVYKNGTKVASIVSTSSSQSGLGCATSYWFGVEAVDAAGNRSARTQVSATTSACPPPPAPTPPPPPAPSGPITITAGGTYSGNWTSTSSAPAVRVSTTEPVTIVNSAVTNRAGGPLVDAVGAGPVQVTLDHVFAYGGDTDQTSGRFFQADGFKSVTIRNSTIENTRGIELTFGVAGSSVLITRNKHHNIKGSGINPVGNFVQFRVVQNATIEVSWNEVVNEYDQSNPEDIISLYHTSNARVHDNMLRHQSMPGNAYNTSSQGGITVDASDAGPGCHNNEIAHNQLLDGYGTSIWGGSNNLTHDNRVVQDGFLPDGVTRIGNGAGGALYISPSGTNNHMQNNIVGYVNRDGARDDFNLSPAEAANNTHMPGSITAATEQNEWALWQQKLAANGITVGA